MSREARMKVADVAAPSHRLFRHRLVNAALADELKGGLHALAIKAYAPGEPIA
jgi:BolA protein